jgi:hypothetical protein
MKTRGRLIIACRDYKSDQQLPQEIKMNQNEIIKNALKLTEKLDQLETRLWNRYYNQFLQLLAEEDIFNPPKLPIDTQKTDCPF